jgi:hypothetical protein
MHNTPSSFRQLHRLVDIIVTIIPRIKKNYFGVFLDISHVLAMNK